jgi:hypothetical protein
MRLDPGVKLGWHRHTDEVHAFNLEGHRRLNTGESIGPGLRQLTLTPVPSRSRAMLRVSATTAPFDAV